MDGQGWGQIKGEARCGGLFEGCRLLPHLTGCPVHAFMHVFILPSICSSDPAKRCCGSGMEPQPCPRHPWSWAGCAVFLGHITDKSLYVVFGWMRALGGEVENGRVVACVWNCRMSRSELAAGPNGALPARSELRWAGGLHLRTTPTPGRSSECAGCWPGLVP